MITEIVWSPIKDTDEKNIKNSPIWKNCFKDEEFDSEIKKLSNTWYRYTVKFDGLKPVQVTSMKSIKTNYHEGNKNKKNYNKRNDRK